MSREFVKLNFNNCYVRLKGNLLIALPHPLHDDAEKIQPSKRKFIYFKNFMVSFHGYASIGLIYILRVICI